MAWAQAPPLGLSHQIRDPRGGGASPAWGRGRPGPGRGSGLPGPSRLRPLGSLRRAVECGAMRKVVLITGASRWASFAVTAGAGHGPWEQKEWGRDHRARAAPDRARCGLGPRACPLFPGPALRGRGRPRPLRRRNGCCELDATAGRKTRAAGGPLTAGKGALSTRTPPLPGSSACPSACGLYFWRLLLQDFGPQVALGIPERLGGRGSPPTQHGAGPLACTPTRSGGAFNCQGAGAGQVAGRVSEGLGQDMSNVIQEQSACLHLPGHIPMN